MDIKLILKPTSFLVILGQSLGEGVDRFVVRVSGRIILPKLEKSNATFHNRNNRYLDLIYSPSKCCETHWRYKEVLSHFWTMVARGWN
jgi:hypothetical protein